MPSLVRVCLASSLGVFSLIGVIGMPHFGQAHGRSYVVQANDSLSAISYRYHVSQQALMSLNGISDPDRLMAGQVLTLPAGSNGAYGTEGADWRNTRYQAPLSTQESDSGSAGFSAPSLQSGSLLSASTGPTMNSGSSDAISTASGTGTLYFVRPGDTLGGISARFNISLFRLVAANGIDSPDVLRVGQRLVIPTLGLANASSLAPLATQTTPMASTVPDPAQTVPMASPIPAVVRSPGGALGNSAPSLAPAVQTQAGVGALLTTEAQTYGIDPALVKAVAWQESGWQMVTAADGGIGVMQLMPDTAAWVGPSLLGRTIDPNNLTDNVQAGVALLAYYMRQYGNDATLALAAYNEGPKNLTRGILPSTAQYIASVLSLRSRF